MYSIDTIKKVISLANKKRNELEELDASQIKICISSGNKKIGKVLNVSLMPIVTCHNCSECKYLCYDIKACVQYPQTIIDARMRNTVLLEKDRNEFFRRIDEKMARRKKNKFFRFHVAGDIIDIDYFDRMAQLAKKHTDFVIWTYTKHYSVVNKWIDVNGTLPENLHVMFSEWRGMPMQNPHNMPEFKVVFKDEQKPRGFYCPGNCDICKASNRGCVNGETVYCNEH